MPDDSELRAARRRLRRRLNGEPAAMIYDDAPYGYDREVCLDEQKVVLADLAAHPDDDETPVDAAWLDANLKRHQWATDDVEWDWRSAERSISEGSSRVRVVRDVGKFNAFVNGQWWATNPTRGQLRCLVAALDGR